MNKGFIKLSLLFAGLVAIAGVAGFLVSVRNVQAFSCPQGTTWSWQTFRCEPVEPACGTEIEYTFNEDDGNNQSELGVHVEFQSPSNNSYRQFHVNATGGYKLVSVFYDNETNGTNWLSVSLQNDQSVTFNPDASGDANLIDKVKVVVVKDCPQVDVCSNIEGTQTTLPDGYKFESEGVCVEIVYGCTNPEATNYNPKANEDDQSCEFDHPVDVCSNIEGDQENVPDGYVAVGEECFPAETGGGDEPERGFIETSPAGAPTCDGVPFVKLPANALVKRMGDDAVVQWQPTQGSEAVIYYREVGNPSNAHSLVNPVNNDGYEDNLHLLGSLDWEFGVQQKDGCAFSGIVWVVDDDTPYQQFDLPAYDVVTGEFLN